MQLRLPKLVTPTHADGYVLKITSKVLLIIGIHLTHTLKRTLPLKIYSKVIYIPVNMGGGVSQNASTLEAG